jgi:hypothetical protein
MYDRNARLRSYGDVRLTGREAVLGPPIVVGANGKVYGVFSINEFVKNQHPTFLHMARTHCTRLYGRRMF